MTSRLLVSTLFFGAFVANMNAMALSPFLSPVAEDVNSTVPLVAQAATAALIIGAIIGLILGPISDHFGIRRTLLVGALLMTLSGIGTALAFDFWTLVITRIPGGIAAGMLLGLGISVVNTRLPEEERRPAIGWLAGGAALAVIVGIPLLAFLADLANWRAGFWLVGVLGLGLAIAYLRVISPDPPAPDEPFRPFTMFQTYRELLSERRMVGLQFGNMLWSLVWIGGATYFGAYMMDKLGFSLTTVGYMAMWVGVWFFVGTRSAALLTKYWSPQVLMVPNGVLMSLSIGAFFTVPTSLAELLLIFGPLGFAGGLGVPLTTFLISESASTAPGSVMMLRQFTWGIGSGIGAASGGLLLGVGGYEAVGAGLAGFSLLAIGAILLTSSTATAAYPEPLIGRE